MIGEVIARVGIALIFAAIGTIFLNFSFFMLKKSFMLKENIKAAGVLALGLFVFSFFPNIFFSILVALLGLAAIKLVYIRTWKETLKIWGIWMGLWIALFIFIAGAIHLAGLTL